MLEQILTPEVEMALTVLAVLCIALYIMSIFWAVRDAQSRGYVWAVGLLAIIPVVGLIGYCMIRPPLLQADREEQDLEVALKQRELMKYGDCANCGFPVEADYVLCPSCHSRLKNLCPTCHRALDPEWDVCPYCTTPIQ